MSYASSRRPALDRDEARQRAAIEDLARWMDELIEVPGVGVRFGLDALVGLIPGLGDTVTSLVSVYILVVASRLGVSRITMTRMALNVAVDYILGAVPLVGDVFDVFWKANSKNIALLRRDALASSDELRRSRRGDWLFVAALIFVLIALLVGSIVIAYWLLAWLASAISGAWR